jgi:hypothetical protein
MGGRCRGSSAPVHSRMGQCIILVLSIRSVKLGARQREGVCGFGEGAK